MEKKKDSKKKTTTRKKTTVAKKPVAAKKTTVKKKKKNKPGFTLIELLAVIIILGVVMIIAIPSVTKYISSSRDNAYVASAKEIVSGARVMVNSGELNAFNPDVTYYIPISCISTENTATSPYGDWKDAYVVFTYERDGYDYYWTSIDEAKQGVYLASVDQLDNKKIVRTAKDINTGIAISGHNKVSILDAETCSVFSEPSNSIYQMPKRSYLTPEQYEETSRYITFLVNGKSYSVLNNKTWKDLRTDTVISDHHVVTVNGVPHGYKYVGNKSNVTFCIDKTEGNKNVAGRVYMERNNITGGIINGESWRGCFRLIDDDLGVYSSTSRPSIFYKKTITEGEFSGLTYTCVEYLLDSSNQKLDSDNKPVADASYHTNHDCDDFTLVDINF